MHGQSSRLGTESTLATWRIRPGKARCVWEPKKANVSGVGERAAGGRVKRDVGHGSPGFCPSSPGSNGKVFSRGAPRGYTRLIIPFYLPETAISWMEADTTTYTPQGCRDTQIMMRYVEPSTQGQTLGRSQSIVAPSLLPTYGDTHPWGSLTPERLSFSAQPGRYIKYAWT